jgi:dihydropyrimidine dehydrogenase (NAD+) subunit PreA
MVLRAFDAGWGGVVWKTIGAPSANVAPRLASTDAGPLRVFGLGNIELISDRPVDVNLREMAGVKKRHPDRILIASVMMESTREAWHDIVRRVVDAGVDGVELNLGCPHGMPRRGMGSAVGQVPEYTNLVTSWVKEVAPFPVLVKLTPNVTDIVAVARAAVEGGADGVSLINTINSVIGVDLETMVPRPDVNGVSAHGGYSGEAVRPIALHMVSSVAKALPATPLSGIGGVGRWQDAAEFLLLGATTVQVCTAVMRHGYGIVGEMARGLSEYLDGKAFSAVSALTGRAAARLVDWGRLDLNHQVAARIRESLCVRCNNCVVACRDGGYQAIVPGAPDGRSAPVVAADRCTGCGLCPLVCPVPGCITLEPAGAARPYECWEARAARAEEKPPR